MTSDTSPQLVERKLRRAWRKERRFHHSQGLAHALMWVVTMVLVDLLIDWLFLVPGTGRLALLAANLLTLGWVFHHHWLRHLKPYDPVVVALQVERQHPELESVLVSFVQLSGDGAQAAYASPALLRALEQEAIEATRPIDFREIISFRELRRIAMVSAGMVLVFAICSVNWSQHMQVLLKRMINPKAEIGYPTRTRIDWITGNTTVRQGDSITVGARPAGVIPKRGTLWVRPQGGEWEKLALLMDDDWVFAYRFREVFQPFEYWVRLGDARSKKHTVTVVAPPRIVETRVRLQYPAYTKQPTKTVDFLNLEVPEGTQVQWELVLDKALSGAEVIVGEAEAIPLDLDRAGLTARLSTTATASLTYQFRWTDLDYGYDHEDETHYFLQVIPDSPPQVEIVAPSTDDKATVRKTLTVSFLARDDYGIADAWIVYTLNDAKEKRRRIGPFDAALVEIDATWKLAAADSIPQLKAGDIVTYAIEVCDSHDGKQGPHKTRSDSRRLFIVSVEEYLEYILEKRRQLRTEIEGLRDQEQEGEGEVEKLKDETPEPKPAH